MAVYFYEGGEGEKKRSEVIHMPTVGEAAAKLGHNTRRDASAELGRSRQACSAVTRQAK